MSLSPDQMLAHYRLVEKIGEGGMGQVWRAVDTSLDREVAIKVLPAAFAADPDRLARFEREAKVLASLNHPCIAQVFGFHESEGVRFLAMELVRGEDLAQRLASGALGVTEATRVARRMAQALEAAHESGVIHRDLKPANVILTPDGGAKVLDFGLAKMFQPDPVSGSGASLHPTMTSDRTQEGVILGTAAYMSPEQARGRTIDRRSDIWSFGCVLYEMLAGRHLFRGETISDTIALILQSEPDWAALPATTPPRLRELLARCLDKDPHNRLRDIGDARIELERMAAAGSGALESGAVVAATARPPRDLRKLLAGAGLLFAGALLGAVGWSLLGTRGTAPSGPTRVSIQAPPGILPSEPRLTADGRTVVFVGEPAETDAAEPEPSRIFVRRLDAAEAVPVPGTERASVPALSPDGRWLAYRAPVREGSTQQRIFKVPLDGSAPPLQLADWSDDWGASLIWLDADRIVGAAQGIVSIVSIATDGSGVGEAVPVASDVPLPGITLTGALPDGLHLVGHSASWEGQGYHTRIFVVNVETGELRKVLDPACYAQWSATGHLLFTRLDTLLAIPFDPARLETTGGPITLANGLWTFAGEYGGPFDVAAGGALVHRTGGREGSRQRIVTVDEDGSVTPWSEDRMSFPREVMLSPDGRHLAATVMSPDTLLFTIWLSETERPSLRMWMTMPGLDCTEPVWLPDSSHLLFDCEGADPAEGIFLAPLDGSAAPRRVYTEAKDGADGAIDLLAVHPGGRHVLLTSYTGGRALVMRFELDEERDGLAEGVPLVPGRRRTWFAQFSPDGNWVSYLSDDSGRRELFVARFHPDGSVGPSTLVATPAADRGFWRRTGRAGVFDLLYLGGKSRVNKVTLDTTSGLSVSRPELDLDFSKIRPELFSAWTQTDGRTFAIQEEERTDAVTRLELILDYPAALP